MKQLHPTRLTQGPVAHRCFWEGRQVRFPALPFTPHSTYSRWDTYQALAVASQGVRRRPDAIAIIVPHEYHKWRSAPGRPGDPLYDGKFQPLHVRSSPNCGQTHNHFACRWTYTASCSAVPEVRKVKPAHHLLR